MNPLNYMAKRFLATRDRSQISSVILPAIRDRALISRVKCDWANGRVMIDLPFSYGVTRDFPLDFRDR